MRIAPLAALLLATLSTAAGAAERAAWIWEADSYRMLNDPAAADAAIRFARARHLETLYLYADQFGTGTLVVTHPEAYRTFIRQLHAARLHAYALLGSAFLHTEAYVRPEQRDAALAMFRRVLSYNAHAQADERFDGVNLDIEPHILEDWDTRKFELLGGLLDLSAALMDLKHASGQSLVVGPAMPFWYEGITLEWRGTRTSMAEHMLGLFDYAALMDYRDHALGADGIVSHASGTLAIAGRLHKPLVVGVDVTPSELKKLSFDHLREADLERELGLAEGAFAGEDAFGGFAIHHFGAYRDWLERARPVP